MLHKQILLISAAALSLCFAQQKVPFDGGIPLAPTGLAGKKLGPGPFLYDTGEGQRIKVTVQNRLAYPFSATWLPDGTMLVTSRTGELRALRKGVLDPKPVAGVPKSYWAVESGLPGAVHGLMDVVLHPKFAENQWVYLTYTKPMDAKTNVAALARGRWDGKGLVDVKDLLVLDSVRGSLSRIAFDRAGFLYMSTTGADPQSVLSLGGKVLRLTDEGKPAPDNPFAKQAGAHPEIFTMGHRNTLAMAMNPNTGEIWATENGPNGGDELNILKAGANYGWPLVSLGRMYPGPWQGKNGPSHQGYEAPVVYWTPAIGISGLMFYTGDKLPKWKGDVFVGSMRTGEIPGTGHVDRVLFNEKMEELRRESLLTDLHQRVRDVKQGPDGFIYVLTDEKDGAILRIEPAAVALKAKAVK